MIFLDTHVLVWLYAGHRDKLSKKAVKLIESHDLKVSPMVLLELHFLYEIKRIKIKSRDLYDDLHLRIGLSLDDYSWISVVQASLDISWTRDPFDRLIVAHSESVNCKLLTKDSLILSNYSNAVW